MLSFISAKEAAEKWNISQRRVAVLCSEQKIPGAMIVGNKWIIPSDAEKPVEQSMPKRENIERAELKPFVKWVGGKSHLIEKIEEFIPAGAKKYAEPMVGGGALFFSIATKYSFEDLYIGDTNSELINAYAVVKERVDDLIEELYEMQLLFSPMDENGRKYFYYTAREKFNGMTISKETTVKKAALFIFLNKTCFNGLYRVNKSGQFNVPMGAYKNPLICDEDNLRNASKILCDIKIVCGDYTDSKKFIDKDTFVYIDPPYRPISKTSAFTSYNTECFNDGEQIRLAEYFREIDKIGATIVLSNSDPKNINPDDNFFEELYRGFKIHRVSAPRMINSKSDSRGKISELLICNK